MQTETSTTPPAAPAGEGTAAPAAAAVVAATPVENTPAAPAQAGSEQATPDTKPDAAKEPEAKAPEKAPAAIEVKLPEGVEAEPALLDALKGAAKDSTSAQALVDAYAAANKAATEKAAAAWEQQKQQWVADVKADKGLGGPAFDKNFQLGVRALEKFGTPELNELLANTGISHHPAFFRFTVGIGRAMAEDTIAGTNNGGPAAPRSEEERLRMLFPNSPGLFKSAP